MLSVWAIKPPLRTPMMWHLFLVLLQVVNIEDAILSGKHLSNNELTELIDSLMCQLVILDANKVEGDTNVQKTILVCNTFLFFSQLFRCIQLITPPTQLYY